MCPERPRGQNLATPPYRGDQGGRASLSWGLEGSARCPSCRCAGSETRALPVGRGLEPGAPPSCSSRLSERAAPPGVRPAPAQDAQSPRHLARGGGAGPPRLTWRRCSHPPGEATPDRWLEDAHTRAVDNGKAVPQTPSNPHASTSVPHVLKQKQSFFFNKNWTTLCRVCNARFFVSQNS